MTTEPKLLTEADVSALYELARNATPENFRKAVAMQGLIAEEPVDPLLVEARQIIADTCDTHESKGQWLDGVWDDEQEMDIALAALRRGMELAPSKELTREMVAAAVSPNLSGESYVIDYSAIHAALTEALQ